MSNARNLADVITVNYDVPAGSLDNVDLTSRVAKSGDTMTGNLIVDGNVGINTSSPLNRLTTRATANSYVGGNLSLESIGGANATYFAQTTPGDFYISNGGTADHFKMDSAGRVTMPYQPAFLIKAPSTYTGNGTVGGTELFSYTDEVINVGGHFNTTTSTFTAPITGMYAVSWWASASTNSLSTRYIRLRLYKNGAVYLNPHNTIANESGDSDYNLVGASAVVFLSASDTINVQWGSSTATNQMDFYSDMCFFSGYLLG